jgi:metal-responsive CopG/Arc/MetJ family transcriptional regulator
MKSIQITFDETLLAALDATEEVKKDGRSAVMRRAVEMYLKRRRNWEIAERYRNAYAADGGSLEGFEGWEDQGAWPDE